MNVPRQYLDENRLQWILGDSVKRIWIPQTTNELQRLVKEREDTAMRLEKAEFELINIANTARTKYLQKAEAEMKSKPLLPPFDFEKQQSEIKIGLKSETVLVMDLSQLSTNIQAYWELLPPHRHNQMDAQPDRKAQQQDPQSEA
jgi:hypothetical protein